MLQAQVTSKGEIIAADAVAQQNGIYQVVVTTRQTTGTSRTRNRGLPHWFCRSRSRRMATTGR